MSVIFKAGTRPALTLGGDRELNVAAVGVTFALVWQIHTIPSVLFGAAFLACALWSTRRMAKADPLMRQVYGKSLWYAGWYPARGSV